MPPPPIIPKKHLELKVSAFDDTLSKYQNFKQAVNIVCDRKQASAAERLYLTEHLIGKPAKLIENIPLNEHGHKLAWEILDAEYNDPARIKNEIFLQLTNLPPAKDDPFSLKETLDTIESLLQILESYQTTPNEVNNDETYRRLVLAKFPRSIIRHITNPGETPTLKQARTNLQATIRTELDVQTLLEPVKALNTVSNAQTGTPRPIYTVPTATPATERNQMKQQLEIPKQQPEKLCHFCKGSHWSDECNKFTTIDERKKALMDACTLCLKAGHNIDTCLNNRPCFHCKERRKHNSALCPKRYGSSTSMNEITGKRDEKPTKNSTTPALSLIHI